MEDGGWEKGQFEIRSWKDVYESGIWTSIEISIDWGWK